MLNPPWTGWVWTAGKGWGGPRLIRAHLLFSVLSKVLLIFSKKVKTFTSTSESRFRDCRVLFAWNSTHYWLIADNIFYPPSFPAFPSQSRTRRTARVPCMWPKISVNKGIGGGEYFSYFQFSMNQRVAQCAHVLDRLLHKLYNLEKLP